VLFNSYTFLLVFLPVVLGGFFLLGRHSPRWAAAWLAAASVFFYGWWNPAYVGLLLGSILFNYVIGYSLARGATAATRVANKSLLSFGVAGNLLLLGYYKYANFFIANLNALSGTELVLAHIILPLGISFFTFTQIAFLVDAYQGKAREYSFVHYCLFVTYFPHLIAGPVLHHKEMMPQFAQATTYRLRAENITIGSMIFFIGLFKKVVLADGVAPYAGSVFDAAAGGERLEFFQAWGGALAYTMQLYFDFSGYSDMAIGLSRLFGIALPLNFHSPYKATNIIEFWRRWHMTLSRFLRDYLYIPLGGSRKGAVRRYVNLAITMLLGGLWHGAAWTFVIWGGLHGCYLVINHAWHAVRGRLGHDIARTGWLGRLAGASLTFLAVVVGWVLFRASDLDAARSMLEGMAGMQGVSLPAALGPALGPWQSVAAEWGVRFTLGGGSQFVNTYLWVVALSLVAFLGPNTQEIMRRWRPALDDGRVPVAEAGKTTLAWVPSRRWALAMSFVAAAGILSLSHPTEFLYFQF
jgi:D-alanyl-lipoteichoic acid acyltransferase DltB (MBOAT superfamily)